ncbi:hypothetical protein [Shewanella sp.]|uniref:hypothetical protein n=1 Tax=Shewanella sp. TaxID=50422 RepID=UPI002629B57F|nr:hypothetical protein [Shewanella sp.]
MLKKSLIALAIASVSMATVAAEVNKAVSPVYISKQGIVATGVTDISGTDTTGGKISVTFKAEYKIDDIITFTFTGAKLDSTSAPATVTTIGTTGSMTLGLLDKTADTLVYRVTDLVLGDATTTIGQKLELSGLFFTNASIIESGAVSVTYSASTSNGTVLDRGVDGSNTAKLLVLADEYTSEVSTKFSAVIDVNTKRLSFVDPDDSTKNVVKDKIVLSTKVVTKDGETAISGFEQSATDTEVTYNVFGDFSFLDTDSKKDGIQVDPAKVIPTNSTAKYFADHIELKASTPLSPVSLELNVSGVDPKAADSAIAAQAFKVTSTVDFKNTAGTKGQVTLLSNSSAGEWTLNGALVHVPFMPFRDGYAPIVNVSNTSTQDGDIEVVVYAADNAWAAPKSYTLSVPAKAQAQTNITAALRNAGIKGDVAFDIIVNAPKESIEVSALYYNAGDRAVMNTTKK